MMKQMTRRRSLSAWAAGLVALSSMPAWAQAQTGGHVYIQGSEVNLRDKAATHAKVVAKVTIGTGCQQVKSASKQWVRLKCGDAEGFTLKSLVGAQKPTVEALLAQAQDTTQPAKVRLDAAMRAATLDSENAQALKLLADLFFDVSFEQLARDKKKGVLHETFVVTREIREERPVMKRETGEEGVLRELEKTEYDWHRFQLRGNDFVSAMHRDGALVVYSGSFASMQGRYQLEEDQEEFQVTIESRSNSPVEEVLKRALQQGARSATAGEAKYASIEEEYPGMPALSAEAFRLYRALPKRWYALRPGERYVTMGCGLIPGAELRADLHRRARIGWGELVGRPDGPPQVMRITDIAKTLNGYRLALRNSRGHEEVLSLRWPTAEANVSRWKSEPSSHTDGDYAVENARNVEIRNIGCNR